MAASAHATLSMPDADTLRSLEVYITDRMQEVPSAGLSVAFAIGDRIWARGFGARDISAGLPATPTTSYRMASVTKTFTAVAVMQLWERGVLDLDEDIRHYVPYYPRKSHVVTPRHLLGHLSGIPHYKNCAVECYLKVHHDTRQSIAVFARFPLEHAPGETYTYTSYGYNLLGAAVEEITGKSYGDYMSTHIFIPAGMTHTHLEDARAPASEQARGYRVVKGKLVPSIPVDISSRFAGGGVRSTVLDMVAFGRRYLQGDFVGAKSRRLMETSMNTNDGVLTDYGMGFAITPQSGRFVIAHGGGQAETSTLLVLHPVSGLVIALAANVEDFHPVLHEVRERIVSLVLGDGGRRRIPTGKTIADAALARALSGLMSHGIATFERWGPQESAEYAPLIDAFRVLKSQLDPNAIARAPIDALRRARLGDDPAGGRIYPIAGGYMAAVIANHFGRERLAAYHNDDIIGFMLDYARACDLWSCPLPLQFDKSTTEYLLSLAPSWQRANSPALRQLQLESGGDVTDLEHILEDTFDGASIHPDLSAELLSLSERKAQAGASEAAAALRLLSLRIHPLSAPALLAAWEDDAQRNDVVALRDHLAHWSLASEATTARQAVTIQNRAKVLAKENPQAAITLMQVACDQFDEAPTLHDLLGSLAQKGGDMSIARWAFQRAYELEPTSLRRKRLRSLVNRKLDGDRTRPSP